MPLENLDYKELGRDIYAQAKDGELTQEERTELLEKYESEKCQIQDEACENLQELKSAMDLFAEVLEMKGERTKLKKFQMIIGISKSGRDGIFGPGSFQTFMNYKNETGFEEGIGELLAAYDEAKQHFKSLPYKQRTELQPQGGKDGKFGQGTFRHILKENLIERTQEVSQVVEEISVGDPEVVDVPELEKQEEVEYNNGLRLSDENFQIVKNFAIEIGRNPSYDEFRVEVRALNRRQKMQLQAIVGANVDGQPGKNTYTHYLHSTIREAGFSVEEAASFKKVLSQGASEEIIQIEKAYKVDLSEIPHNFDVGDYFIYDPDYGELTIVDEQTGEKSIIDVAQGIFDSIEVGLKNNDADIIFNTLAQIRGNPDKVQKYISQMQEYISENNSYEQARNILCRAKTKETENGIIYTLDFKGNRALSAAMTAMDVFGDQEFLLDAKGTYIRRYEPSKDFKTLDGNRLSISSGTSVMIPNEAKHAEIKQELETIQQREQLKEAIESNLTEVIQSSDRESILSYLELDDISDRQKNAVISQMKQLVFKGRLFSNMRDMFMHEKEGGLLFETGNDLLATKLTAFDLFGDYKTLISDGKNYLSISERNYTSQGERLKLLAGETIIQIDASSQRTDEEFEKLLTVTSTINVHKLRRPRFMRNPNTGVTLCGETARVFATNTLKAPGTPGNTRYAFNQFHQMPGPKTGEVPSNLRSINKSYNLGLSEIQDFLRTQRVTVAQIYLDAAGNYGGRYYGHVATVVLDKSGKYYVMDAYNGRGRPIELSEYYADRRGEISAGTRQRKDFKGIAKLR